MGEILVIILITLVEPAAEFKSAMDMVHTLSVKRNLSLFQSVTH